MNLIHQTRCTTVLQVSAQPPAQLKCVRVFKVFLGFFHYYYFAFFVPMTFVVNVEP